MKRSFVKYLLLAFCFGLFVNTVEAQKKGRAATKRPTTKKTVKTKTKAKINPAMPKIDTVAVAAVTPAPAAAPVNDSLPVPIVKPSLRRDAAVDDDAIKDRNTFRYEHLSADDAVFRHKIWREIDIREKINLPFRYAADENNGNQRFITILMNAVRKGDVMTFDASVDDRFTTPISWDKIQDAVAGKVDTTPVYSIDDPTKIDKYKVVRNEFNADDIVK